MKLSEVPHEYKIYSLKLSNKDEFIVDGVLLDKIIATENNFLCLPDGQGFNKAFMVNWKLNIEKTKENVNKFRDELLKIEQKQLD